MKYTDKLYTDLFALAHHWANTACRVTDGGFAYKMLGERLYSETENKIKDTICNYLDIKPGCEKSAADSIVFSSLSPLPVALAAFSERCIRTASRLGATQLLLLGGLFTVPYPDKTEIFRIDTPEVQAVKESLLARAGYTYPANRHSITGDIFNDGWADSLSATGYNSERLTTVVVGDLPLYLGEKSFKQLLASLFKIIPQGSGIVFCYPDGQFFTDTDRISTAFLRRRQKNLLSGASYGEVQMEKLLSDQGFRLYEHLNPRQVHSQFFHNREIINRRKLAVCDHINYCLAVKK